MLDGCDSWRGDGVGRNMSLFKMKIAALTALLLLSACGGSDTNTNTMPPTDVPIKIEAPVAKPDPQPKPTLSPELNGEKFYKKCAACHRPNGDGIPGSFPPLNSGVDILASTEEGRTYLVLVVQNGLRGTLETNGGTFNGIMVRQAAGKSPADVADLLNYILNSFYEGNTVMAFTADEVKTIKDANGRVSGNQVLALRPKADKE